MAMVLTFVYRRLSRSRKAISLRIARRTQFCWKADSAVSTASMKKLQQCIPVLRIISSGSCCISRLSSPEPLGVFFRNQGGLKSWGVQRSSIGSQEAFCSLSFEHRRPFSRGAASSPSAPTPALAPRVFGSRTPRPRFWNPGRGSGSLCVLVLVDFLGLICGHSRLIWGFGRLSSQVEETKLGKREFQVYGPGKPRVSKPLDFPVLGTELSSQNIQKRRKPQCQAHYTHDLRSAKQGGDAGICLCR